MADRAKGTGAATTTDDERDLIRLQNAWMEAWRLKDRDALDAIIVDDFTLISATTDQPVSRPMWMAGAMGPITCRSFAYLDLRVRVYGDAAVVQSRYEQDASIGDADWSGTFLLTDVWIRQDGACKVVARHSSQPPDAAAAPSVAEAAGRDLHAN